MDGDRAKEIELQARQLQRLIYDNRKTLCPDWGGDFQKLLEPSLAAAVLGINITEHLYLGSFGSAGDRFEVAGSIDRTRKEICISIAPKFSEESRKFTAAHEIGHWALHPDGEKMHRDRSIGGLERNSKRRPQEEQEADYFAACFLMPARLVRREFESRFGKPPFKFNEHTSFQLDPSDSNSLLYCDPKTLGRESALATCRSLGVNQFPSSLVGYFGVSVSSMAIRLQELNVVKWP